MFKNKKMSENRKKKRGIPTNINNFKEKRNLSPQELREYLQLVTISNTERWKAIQYANNTALLPNGKELAKQQEAIANLLHNSIENWISHTLQECGVQPGQAVNINSTTGVVEYAKANMEKEQKHIKVDKKEKVTKDEK